MRECVVLHGADLNTTLSGYAKDVTLYIVEFLSSSG